MAQALEAPSPSLSIFSGNKTIIGQTIAYPGGTPMVNAIILTVPPGAQYDWHTHQAPVFGYILEGELTIDYGSKGVRVYKAGESVLEAVDWPHRPSNRGAVVTRVLAINIGAEGVAFGDPAAGPK
jgi:quercetin dioxygenase-like cupin family protein